MLTSLLHTHVRRRLPSLALILPLQLIQTTAALSLPTLNADLLDRGVVPGDIGHVLRTGAWMAAATVLQLAASVGAAWLGARAALDIGRELRAAVFGRALAGAAHEVGRIGVSSLVMRTTSDVQQVQMFCLTMCTVMVTAPLMCFGGIVMALRQDVALSGVVAVVAPLLALAVGWAVRRTRPLFRDLQHRLDVTHRLLREQLTGVRVVRAFVREDHERARFDRANTGLLNAALRTGRLMAVLLPVVLLVVNASTVVVVWAGGHRIADGTLRVGALTAFLTYLAQILTSVMAAGSLFVLLPRAEVSAERIREVLDLTPGPSSTAAPGGRPARTAPRGPVPRAASDRIAPSGARDDPPTGRTTPALELSGVEFRYPGAEEPVLRDVTLTLRPGEVVAVTGSAGAGKSTLLDLMVRSFDPTSGAVRLGGTDVRALGRAELAGAIGYAPQRPHLFSGTVASNLRYAKPDAGDEELWRALRTACADTFVTGHRGGLDAPVLQGGGNLSGGQRQRLVVARALVHRPAVCLLDDPFSALDQATEARLRTALAGEAMTTVVVTQRVSALCAADRVAVLDGGRLIGVGPHADLLDSCPTYREIVLASTSGEAV
ncbi:ABC transporter ATP-binding protein/permease [Streptomyces sp. J2-1]|uniref:ABC transporter ATP-binding protein n=1 Tax=Streptomyces corallincola TaxID=2851888 RepID=UPI001C38B6A1|nr:ABC transporter ATP-binding protein [Streptomyces corallincola]MBV2354931.1 ABC transporter ATP-binding protein/permease [Streptomyces corallincola]